jgi:hypothetical protein
MSRLFLAVGLLVSSFTLGCTDDPDGTPPSISNLQLAPTTLTAHAQNAMTGSLAFVDPDADVTDLGIELELPDGSRQPLPLTDVRDSAGTTEGTIQISLAIVPPAAGDYQFDLWLEDAKGHASDRLQASAQAVLP